jgi:hypothetical protein
MWEMFEDTKEVSRSRKLKKDIQYNEKQNQDSSHIYMTCQFPGLVQALEGIQLDSVVTDAVTQVFPVLKVTFFLSSNRKFHMN